MAWWIWVLLGLVLMGFELFTPGGFFLLFFGASAVVVGIVAALGITGAAWVEWLLFSVISVAAVVLLRGPLVTRARPSGPDTPVDTLVGELATPQTELAPGATGKAELRGSTWTAHNDDSRPLAPGQRCRVTRVDGLAIWIRAE